MKIILIITLAIVKTTALAGCPTVCKCTESSILCIKANLRTVPSFENLSQEPIIIDLSGNKINIIDDEDFSFMQNNGVKEIYLNNSEILDIDSSAFEELQNLQELYLGENLLKSVPEDFIEDLPNMILLDLSNNYFTSNMPLIRSKSLEVLAMANSKITNVPEDTLKYLPKLSTLILQENNIKTMSTNVFAHINAPSFYLKMPYNPWTCSCENLVLFTVLNKRKYIDRSEAYTCLQDDIEVDFFEKNHEVDIMSSKCLNDGVLNDESEIKLDILVTERDESLSLLQDDKLQAPLYVDAFKTMEKIENKEALEESSMKVNNATNWFQKIRVALAIADNLSLLIFCGIFVMGFILGCSMKYLISATSYEKLQQSDSSLFIR